MSKTIQIHELHEELQAGRIDRLWNVQTELLFEGESIPGSKHVPLDRLRAETALTRAPASATIVVYSGGPGCLQGKLAVGMLNTLGYTEARSLSGGLHAWRAAGLPVTTRGNLEYVA